MNHLSLCRLTLLSGSFLVSACVSLSSVEAIHPGKDGGKPEVLDVNDAADGIVYHLPKRPIVVSITLDKDSASTKVSVAAGEAEPDMTTQYLLRFPPNLLATEHPVVVVNEKGLLTSAGADTKSGVQDALTSIASTLGMVTALASIAGATRVEPSEAVAQETCIPGQTYTVVIDPSAYKPPVDMPTEGQKAGAKCGYTIFITPPTTATRFDKIQHKSGGDSGVFYRQTLPYLVKVADPGADGASRTFTVFSPTGSPAFFAPVNRSFFADSNLKLAFNDGVLTGYDSNSDGELVAAVKIPAAVLSAYFSAIGSMFTTQKGHLADQQAVLQAQSTLAMAKLQSENCKAAIAAHKKDDDMTLVKAACAAGN